MNPTHPSAPSLCHPTVSLSPTFTITILIPVRCSALPNPQRLNPIYQMLLRNNSYTWRIYIYIFIFMHVCIIAETAPGLAVAVYSDMRSLKRRCCRSTAPVSCIRALIELTCVARGLCVCKCSERFFSCRINTRRECLPSGLLVVPNMSTVSHQAL